MEISQHTAISKQFASKAEHNQGRLGSSLMHWLLVSIHVEQQECC